MDLECLQHHMRGQKVRVEGTLYTIGTDGILRDVPEKDGKELLGMYKCWRAAPAKVPGAALASAPKPEEPQKPEAKAPEAKPDPEPEKPQKQRRKPV